MNKTLLVSSLIACLSIASVNVYAEGESSISIGYAQSRVKEDGYKLDKNPRGFNLKYRYEFNNDWGVIGSFAQTRRGVEESVDGFKLIDGDFKYYSVTAGPVFRINEYVSLYGLLGGRSWKG